MIPPPDPYETIVKLIKLGQAIRERYLIYKNAREDLSELDNRLHSSLFVMGVFEKVIRHGLADLPVQQQHEIGRLVDGLQGIFDRLDKQLERFPRDAKFDFKQRLQWTFGGKSGHEAALEEMKEWRGELYLVVSAIQLLQQENQKDTRVLYSQLFEEDVGGRAVYSVRAMDETLRDPRFPHAPETNITVSGIEATIQTNDPSHVFVDGDRQILRAQSLLVEYRYEESRSSQEAQEFLSDIQKLYLVMSRVDAPSMHILRCKGTFHQAAYKRSALMYELPSIPQEAQRKRWTLSQAIADKSTAKPALDVRIRYAVETTTAVLFTHSAGLVHKSISPDNILILSSSFRLGAAALLPTQLEEDQYETFLIGFDTARLRDLSAYSEQRPETDKVRKVYHHPERQVYLPNDSQRVVRFGIRHDMYSLGIVLLEIAMWRRVHKFSDKKLSALIDLIGRDGEDPYELQRRLVDLAQEYLGGLMGPRYTDAVVTCLRASIHTWEGDSNRERAMREVFYGRVLRQLKGIMV